MSHRIEGAEQNIWCDESTPGWVRCGIDRAFFEYLIANAAALERQGRYVPYHEDEQPRGIRTFGLRRGSLPRLLGFNNGDLILAINGTPSTSPLEVITMLLGASEITRFDIDIEHRGDPVIITIDVVE